MEKYANCLLPALRAYVYAGTERSMRLPDADEIRKSVVYVGVETDQGQFVPWGTGFLIAAEMEEAVFMFVVTARHVIDRDDIESFAIRLNRKAGDASCIKVPKKSVIWSEKSEDDLALIPVGLGKDVYDFKMVRLERSALETAKEITYGIGLGDEVYTVGLYTSHYGILKNRPIIRIGNISALPEEPVHGPAGYVDAYLIETRTIAGLSGSPVYLNPPQVYVRDKEIEALVEPVFLPIGVLVGYHVVESADDQIQVPQFAHEDVAGTAPSIDERNTGFGVVVPIERVLEMLEDDEMKAIMKSSLENHRKGRAKPASVTVLPSVPKESVQDSENPRHREDFNRLLSAAVKPPKSSDQT